MVKICFEDLPIHHQWHRFVADGSFEMTMTSKKEGNRVLSNDARLTIALNQVFLLQCYPDAPLDGTRFPAYSDAYNSLKALPALAYQPLTITDAQAAEWATLTPCQQLHRCWAPHGWVHPDLAVLPFSCTITHAMSSKTRLLLQGRFRSPILVIVHKAIYVGDTPDWIKGLQPLVHSSRSGRVWREELVSEQGLKAYEHLKVDGLDDVAEFLEAKFRGEPELLVTYRTLQNAVGEAFKKWVPFGLRENRHVPRPVTDVD